MRAPRSTIQQRRLAKILGHPLRIEEQRLRVVEAAGRTGFAKVGLSLTALQEMRTQNLIAKTKQIRDLANGAKTEPGATDRGITQAAIIRLTAAIAVYEPLANAPRAKIVNRAALLRELETRTAELVESVRDLDDLVVQFHGTEAGRRFIDAWQQARTIVDAGHGPTTPAPPSPTP